jgi:hypothetical protein
MSSTIRSRALRCAAIAVWLFVWATFWGCGAASEEAPSFVSLGVVRPIRPDREMAARIGRQALAEYGYEEIIRRAVKAHFLRYPDPPKLNAGNLVGQTMAEAAKQAWPVFTQWAVAAAITSQLDSPAPGPADVVAIGELVVGLFRAGAIGVMVLTMSSDNAGSTTPPAVPTAVSMATAMPTTTAPPMPTTMPLADEDLWRKCQQQHETYKKTEDEAADVAKRTRPLENLLQNNKWSAQERVEFCSLLAQKTKLVQRVYKERSKYIELDCDKFDWFNTGRTAAGRLASHELELNKVDARLKNLYDLKKRFCQ